MTPIAIAVLTLATGLLWGGLVWSLARLRKHPDFPDDDQPPST